MSSGYVIEMMRLKLSWDEFERALIHFQQVNPERLIGDRSKIRDAIIALDCLLGEIDKVNPPVDVAGIMRDFDRTIEAVKQAVAAE